MRFSSTKILKKIFENIFNNSIELTPRTTRTPLKTDNLAHLKGKWKGLLTRAAPSHTNNDASLSLSFPDVILGLMRDDGGREHQRQQMCIKVDFRLRSRCLHTLPVQSRPLKLFTLFESGLMECFALLLKLKPYGGATQSRRTRKPVFEGLCTHRYVQKVSKLQCGITQPILTLF